MCAAVLLNRKNLLGHISGRGDNGLGTFFLVNVEKYIIFAELCYIIPSYRIYYACEYAISYFFPFADEMKSVSQVVGDTAEKRIYNTQSYNMKYCVKW